MPLPVDEFQRSRRVLHSPGHDPERFIDRMLPTREKFIYADGGPGKLSPGARGSNPWILGSAQLGTNQFALVTRYKFYAGSPNVTFAIRHSRSGSHGSFKGGTLDKFYFAARGQQEDRGDIEGPILTIPGPGSIFVEGFGAGSVSGTSSNRVHQAMGSRGRDRFGGGIWYTII